MREDSPAVGLAGSSVLRLLDALLAACNAKQLKQATAYTQRSRGMRGARCWPEINWFWDVPADARFHRKWATDVLLLMIKSVTLCLWPHRAACKKNGP